MNVLMKLISKLKTMISIVRLTHAPKLINPEERRKTLLSGLVKENNSLQDAQHVRKSLYDVYDNNRIRSYQETERLQTDLRIQNISGAYFKFVLTLLSFNLISPYIYIYIYIYIYLTYEICFMKMVPSSRLTCDVDVIRPLLSQTVPFDLE